ncbi:monocarboxylate permease, variant 2 [Coprinopsis cinerea AmutBmut pab1-1]|nr:monocarboxylate permease, variant 2 [Coprinopsis cinerea AmutBmut pab1-1]
MTMPGIEKNPAGTSRSDVLSPQPDPAAKLEVEDQKSTASVRTIAAHTDPNPAITIPDGGTEAWLTVLGATLVQYITFGYVNAFGVYQDYYVRVYLTRHTPSEIGWIGGAQLFLTFFAGAFAGRAFDRGYFRSLVISSLLLHSLALFTLSASYANKYYQVFLSHGVALGLSAGLIYIPSLGIVSHHFQKRRPIALGIISSGAALGSVLHPIMLNKLFTNEAIGFHNGVRISAGINTFLYLVAVALMKTRLPPRPAQRYPIGEWLKESAYVVLVVASIFVFLGLFYPVFFLQLTAVSKGVDKNIAFHSIAILNASSLFGRVLSGLAAQSLGSMNVASFVAFATGGSAFAMMAVKNATSTILFAIFYGFFSGAAISIVPSVVAVLAKDVSEMGGRLAVLFMAGGFLGLFASTIGGELIGNGPELHFDRGVIFASVCPC